MTIVTIIKNTYCDKTQMVNFGHTSKIQTMIKQKKSKCDKTQVGTKLSISNCDKTQPFKLQQNSKTSIFIKN